MTRHTTQDVVKDDDGRVDVRPFVQHHALGALGHGRVRNLGSRGLAGAGQVVEDLGRPDHGQMSRLAQPQDLLLKLGEPLVPRLHGQVTAGDHHAHARRPHGVQQNLGQAGEGRLGLDLQNQATALRADPTEILLHGVHIALMAEE